MGLILNRRREMGGELLPYDAQIQYLQSNGSQWIDTGVKFKGSSKIEISFMGLAQNNLAVDIEQGRIRLNVDGKLYKPAPDEIDFNEKYEMSDKEKEFVAEYKKAAVLNYQKYLEISPKAPDKDAVEKQIEALTKEDKAEAEE